MNIFKLLYSKKFMKKCSKTHQITPSPKDFSGRYAPKQTLGYHTRRKRLCDMQLAQPPKSWPPWQILHTPMDYY